MHKKIRGEKNTKFHAQKNKSFPRK